MPVLFEAKLYASIVVLIVRNTFRAGTLLTSASEASAVQVGSTPTFQNKSLHTLNRGPSLTRSYVYCSLTWQMVSPFRASRTG